MPESVHYELSCTGGGDFHGAPALAVFDIDRATANFIIAMAAIVAANDLHKVEKFDYRVSWREDPSIQEMEIGEGVKELERFSAEIDGEQRELVEMRSECDCININKTYVWFTCFRRHCDDVINTGDVAIADLAKAFGLPFAG